jgi:hypothetical protein
MTTCNCVLPGPCAACGGSRFGQPVTFTSESTELVSISAMCGPTQHDYNSTTIERWGLAETVLFCRNCGDTRKVEIPA